MPCPMSHYHFNTWEITDGTTTITLELIGTVSWTPGGWALHEVRDFDGSFTTHDPLRGEENATELSISAKRLGPGGVASDVRIQDIVEAGGVVTGLNSTGGGCPGSQPTYTFRFTNTTSQGSTLRTFSRCSFSGDIAPAISGDMVNLKAMSRSPTVTVANTPTP